MEGRKEEFWKGVKKKWLHGHQLGKKVLAKVSMSRKDLWPSYDMHKGCGESHNLTGSNLRHKNSTNGQNEILKKMTYPYMPGSKKRT